MEYDYEYIWADCVKCDATGVLPERQLESGGKLPSRVCWACRGEKRIPIDIIKTPVQSA